MQKPKTREGTKTKKTCGLKPGTPRLSRGTVQSFHSLGAPPIILRESGAMEFSVQHHGVFLPLSVTYFKKQCSQHTRINAG